MPAAYYAQGFEGVVTFFATDSERFTPEQQQWLQTQLLADPSPWKIVLGHRPLKTYEATKEDGEWQQRDAAQRIVCNTADFFVSGHAHILEDVGPIDHCHIHQIVSGGGGAYPRRVSSDQQDKFFYEGNGFVLLSVNAQRAIFSFYDKDGNLLHELEKKK